MKLVVFSYTCGRNHTYEGAGASGNYGECIARGTKSDLPAAFNALESSKFAEIEQFISTIAPYLALSGRNQAKVLHALFGVTCDRAPDGTQPELWRQPRCPICKGVAASWSPAGRIYNGPGFELTHESWDSLKTSDKRSRMEEHCSKVIKSLKASAHWSPV